MVDKRIEFVDVDKIVPSPLKVRKTIEKEPLQRMATTIKTVDFLQPISAREKGKKYEIIQGERRWRAAKMAGLKQVPVMVKDVDDHRLLMESVIENVQREHLVPIEKAKGLAKVYEFAGFSAQGAASMLMALHMIESKAKKRKPTNEEMQVKKIADKIGLSYNYQYRLLTQLRLPPKEQKRVTELGLGHDKIADIATIKKPKLREKIIEGAPKFKRAEIRKMSKVAKKAPKPLTEAMVKKEIEPETGETLLDVPESKLPRVIEEVKGLRLKPEEVKESVKWLKEKVPPVSQKELKKMLKGYEKIRREAKEKIKTETTKLFRNLSAHTYISGALDYIYCPVCGKNWENLVWKCSGLNVKDGIEKLKKSTSKGGKK